MKLVARTKEHKKGQSSEGPNPVAVLMLAVLQFETSFIRIGGPIETNWTEGGDGSRRMDVHKILSTEEPHSQN